jgi:hypothetical protein
LGSIYRFEKIKRFRQLVDEKALTFVLPELWPDENEGFLFRAVQSEKGIDKVMEALRNAFPNAKPHGLEVALLQAFPQGRYAQCWSKCPENDALWKGYDIRIEAERGDVLKLDGIEAHDVRYVGSIDLAEELRLIFSYPEENKVNWKPENILLIKRTQFSHEQEVRLLTKVIVKNVVNRKPPWVIHAMLEVFRREYQRGERTKEDYERSVKDLKETIILPTRKVSFAHIPNFIRSVMLSPLARSEIDGEMARFCAQHSFNYLGRSKMYEFKL